MNMQTFSEFINLIFSNNIMLTCVCLIFGVVFVNGWTDAPNAIATSVCTRCIGINAAIILSAVFNFLGVFVMSLFNVSVAETISSMVNLNFNKLSSLVAICAALFSVIAFGVLAWAFSIPTSESHALIAGLTGSMLALSNGFQGVNFSEWVKVIIGLLVSIVLGVTLGFIVCKTVIRIFKNCERQKSESFFRVAGVVSAAITSFMHGAQDGQKFIGVLMLVAFINKDKALNDYKIPIWAMIIIAVILALGTLSGGRKIIKSVGSDMVPLQKFQAFSSDISSSLALLVCSIFGLPVSTTHAKTAAIVGVGGAVNKRSVNISIFRNMLFAWAVTFPCCCFISYFIARIFIFAV